MSDKTVSYQDIFEDIKFEDADDARSVLSPAAYLADLLFLKEDIGQDGEINDRRKDIKEIPLNREKTYKMVPYLSIANKVMENYLKGDDESFNVDSELSSAVYPFNAPYSLPYNESHVTLNRSAKSLKTDLHEMYTTLIDAPHALVAARELLGLSQEELECIITDEGPKPGQTWDSDAEKDYKDNITKMWGMDTLVNTTLDCLSDLNAFLEYAMMGEKELKEILHQDCSNDELLYTEKLPIPAQNSYRHFYINNGVLGQTKGTIDENQPTSVVIEETGQNLENTIVETGRLSGNKQAGDFLTIVNEDGTAKLKVINVGESETTASFPTVDYYDRFHRFVRLAKALGWSYKELDMVLMTICNGVLNERTIPYVALVKHLVDSKSVTVEEVCSLFATVKDFGEGDEEEKAHLFYQVFNKGFEKDIYTIESSEVDLRLMATLGISSDELAVLKGKYGSTLPTTEEEKKRYLSTLYRVTKVSKLMNHSFEDLFLLLDIVDLARPQYHNYDSFGLSIPFTVPTESIAELLFSAPSLDPVTLLTASDSQLAADFTKKEAVLWALQMLIVTSDWLTDKSITVSELNYMLNGVHADTLSTIISEDDLRVRISQWNELFTPFRFTKDLLQSSSVSKEILDTLTTKLAEEGIVDCVADGIVTRTASEEELEELLVSCGVHADSAKVAQLLSETLSQKVAEQRNAFYTALQMQFGISANSIEIVCEKLCKSPGESENAAIQNLMAPVFVLSAPTADEATSTQAFEAVKDFYTILQQHLMMIGKVSLHDREVETLFDVHSFARVSATKASEVAPVSNMSAVTQAVQNPFASAKTVFISPANGSLVSYVSNVYTTYDTNFNQMQQGNFTTATGMTDPGIGELVATVNPTPTTLLLFGTNSKQVYWNGTTWSPISDIGLQKNNIEATGSVDSAFMDSSGFYLFSGDQVYKMNSLTDDGIAKGYPQLIHESEMFGSLFASPVSSITAAFTLGDNLYLQQGTELQVAIKSATGLYEKVGDSKVSTSVLAGPGGNLENCGSIIASYKAEEEGQEVLTLFVKKESTTQCYKYTNLSAGFGNYVLMEGYPQTLSQQNSQSFTKEELGSMYQVDSQPLAITSAVSVDRISDTKAYLFAGETYTTSDDYTERNSVADLWIDGSTEGVFTSIDAGFVSNHGWTYLFSGTQFIRYNSSDYSAMYDTTAIDSNSFFGIAASKIDAAFMMPENPSGGEGLMQAVLLFDGKYARYIMNSDGTASKISDNGEGLVEDFDSLGSGYPAFYHMVNSAKEKYRVLAVYSEIVDGFMVLHSYYKLISDETIRYKKYRVTESGITVTDEAIPTGLAEKITESNLTSIFKGLDTVYYFADTVYTMQNISSSIFTEPKTINTLFGRQGIRPEVKNFRTVSCAFRGTANSVYFVGDSSYVKATYTQDSYVDGFIVEPGYPKANREFTNEGLPNCVITNPGSDTLLVTDVVNVAPDGSPTAKYLLFTSENSVKSDGVDYSVTNIGTEVNALKSGSTILSGFTKDLKTYLFVESGANLQCYRYSKFGPTISPDEGYPKVLTQEIWQDEGFTGTFNSDTAQKMTYGTGEIYLTTVDPKWSNIHNLLMGEVITGAGCANSQTYLFTENYVCELDRSGDYARIKSGFPANIDDFSAFNSKPYSLHSGCAFMFEKSGDVYYGKGELLYCDTQSKGRTVLSGAVSYQEGTTGYLFNEDHLVTCEFDAANEQVLSYSIKPLSAYKTNFPNHEPVKKLLEDENTKIFIGDTTFATVVGSQTYCEAVGETWRLYDDYMGMALLDLDKFFQFKALSSSFDKKDNSILEYLKASTSALTISGITGWSGVSETTNISALHKQMVQHHYASRFNVTPSLLKSELFDAQDTLVNGSALYQMVKSRVDKDEREKVSLDINRDILKQRRDALVGLSLMKLTNGENPNGSVTELQTTRDLYGHLLTDMMMSEDTDISEIKEAILSMQLYYHRFLMGLEDNADGFVLKGENETGTHSYNNNTKTFYKDTNGTHVKIEAVDEAQFEGNLKQWWEWMQNYRVWEANRKVFMYPENYIRPELRKEKSEQFKELEDTLLEGDITNETVETAYKKYLDGFNDVGRLKVVGGYLYQDEKETLDKAVMFGVTRSEPKQFYYATGDLTMNAAPEEGSTDKVAQYDIDWNFWEKINVNINAETVKPVFAFGRMFVFWIEYRPGSMDIGFDGATPNGENKQVFEPIVHYSYYNLNKEWVQPQVLKNIFDDYREDDKDKVSKMFNSNTLGLYVNLTTKQSQEYVEVTVEGNSQENDGLYAVKKSYLLSDAFDVTVLSTESLIGKDEKFPKELLAEGEVFDKGVAWSVYSASSGKSTPTYSFVSKGASTIAIPAMSQETVNVDWTDGTPLSIEVGALCGDNSSGMLCEKDTTTIYPFTISNKTLSLGNNFSVFSDPNNTAFSTEFNANFTGISFDHMVNQNPIMKVKPAGHSNFIVSAFHIADEVWFVAGNGYYFKYSKDEFKELADHVDQKYKFPCKSYNTGWVPPTEISALLEKKFHKHFKFETWSKFKDRPVSTIKNVVSLYSPDTTKYGYYFFTDSEFSFVDSVEVKNWAPIQDVHTVDAIFFDVNERLIVTNNRDYVFYDPKTFEWCQPTSKPANYNQQLVINNIPAVYRPALYADDPRSNIQGNILSFTDTDSPDPIGHTTHITTGFSWGDKTHLFPVDNGGKGFFDQYYLCNKIGIMSETDDETTIKSSDDFKIFHTSSPRAHDHNIGFPIISKSFDAMVQLKHGIGTKYLVMFAGFRYLLLKKEKSGDAWQRISDGQIKDKFSGLCAIDHAMVVNGHLLLCQDIPGSTEKRYKEFTYELESDKLGVTEVLRTTQTGYLNQDWEGFETSEEGTLCSSGGFIINITQKDNTIPSKAKFIKDGFDNPAYRELGKYILQRLSANTPVHFTKELLRKGIGGLLSLESQSWDEMPEYSSLSSSEDSFIRYNATYASWIPDTNSGLDFNGSLGKYYWEIFYHIPYLIANRLNEQQRFEEAKKWFEYVFDPILDKGQKIHLENEVPVYWNFLPFRDAFTREFTFLAEDKQALNSLYDDPFEPHTIAKNRTIAYRKAFVMSYVDNLLDWGDNLFREYTHESINEARMLYMLAYDLLGKKPVSSGAMDLVPDTDFNAIVSKSKLAEKSGALLRLVDVENEPINKYDFQVDEAISLETPNDTLILGDYFYLPENTQFIAYWDRIEERLLNIRTGRNIDGEKVPLPLFQPPLDPMALVKGVASNGSKSTALDVLNVNVPNYRFNFIQAKAKELTNRLSSLGGALLSAMEKRDAEELSLLRNQHEKKIIELSAEIREAQLESALYSKGLLHQQKNNAEFRESHYSDLINEKLIFGEILQLSLMGISKMYTYASASANLGGSLADLIPQIGSPFAMTFGGIQLGKSASQTASAISSIGSSFNTSASLAGITAGYKRRHEEWKFQKQLAANEISAIDIQLEAADIQIANARREIRQAELQRKHNESVDLFMTSKFTNKELYQWMSSKLSGLFYQTYQMALDLAKQAQQSFRFELGLKEDEVNYLTSYYWDSQKKGLLAGEVLMSDLDRMDKGYMEKNSRRFEISKSVSLLDIAPEAVLDLKSKKKCNFTLSEKLFALDFPSHYGRQIKSISVTIPAVVGPYQNVNASLTQQSHYTLLEPDTESMLYLMGFADAPTEGAVRADWRGQQQIAVSRGVNDSGLFQLNFNDERYLPFEGTGAFSTWQLELTGHNGSFDLNTISDVIINVEYTALQGGDQFGTSVAAELEKETFTERKYIDVPQHFSSEWHTYQDAPEAGLQVVLTSDMFPGLEVRAGEAWGNLMVYNPTTNEVSHRQLSEDLSNGVAVTLGNVQGDALVFIVEYEMKYQF